MLPNSLVKNHKYFVTFPSLVTVAMKGLGYFNKNLSIRLCALMKIFPISSPVKEADVSMKAPTLASIKALSSWGFFRIFLSFVRTIQPRLPTSVSHTVSGASSRKWSEWILTRKPAFERILGTVLLPNARSMKKIGGSGCMPLPADCFFDFF